jgi:hypothetical protein
MIEHKNIYAAIRLDRIQNVNTCKHTYYENKFIRKSEIIKANIYLKGQCREIFIETSVLGPCEFAVTRFFLHAVPLTPHAQSMRGVNVTAGTLHVGSLTPHAK